VSLNKWHENQSNLVLPDLEEAASSYGTWDPGNADLQAHFDARTVQYTCSVDTFCPPGLSTPLSPARYVDIDTINGQLLPINDANELASIRPPLTTQTHMFQYDKLGRELSALYNSLSHDGNALQAFDKLIAEIADTSTEILPEHSRVDDLVVPSDGKIRCPFAGCQKKEIGWSHPRDARDHIWIDHLKRRLPCLWDDWCASPS